MRLPLTENQLTSYCFRNAVLVGACRPTIRQAEEDAIRAGQAYREDGRFVWRVAGEIVDCAGEAGTGTEIPTGPDPLPDRRSAS